MDPRRRHLALSLALLPLAPRVCRAGPDGDAVVLRADAGGTAPAPPLRYGAASPGPVLRVGRGAPARLRLVNALARPTSLDLQGVRIPPPLGGAGPLGGTVAPGADAEIAFTPPDSGTFWFHPWVLDPEVDQTAEGLAGLLIVDEPVPPEVDADLAVILTDRWPDPGSDASDADALRIGGQPWPQKEMQRPGSRIRLRLLNASTRRAVTVAFAGATPRLVAVDGQPSELFTPLGGSLPAGPGARFDTMLDLPAAVGSEVRMLVGAGAAAAPALVIATEGEPRPTRGPIRPLPANPLLPPAIPLERATRASLVAQHRSDAAHSGPAPWTLNGVAGHDLPGEPLFRARRNTPVVLALRNAAPELVAFRVHGFAMRLLHDLDDGWEPYWRDAVLVPPGATRHAAFLADLPGRWLVESPFVAQTAGGLRGWFEIR